MVVPLLTLPDNRRRVEDLRRRGVLVRRAQTMEMAEVCAFVRGHWPYWAEGIQTAFAGSPVRVFIATQESNLLGFSAYDIDYRGFFGPTGVTPDRQGEGIGAALLLRCLEAMREVGYLYAIIGAVGPASFYTRVSGAISLPSELPNYTDPDMS
jgi:GNAT superfamily N-acetyltransferase